MPVVAARGLDVVAADFAAGDSGVPSLLCRCLAGDCTAGLLGDEMAANTCGEVEDFVSSFSREDLNVSMTDFLKYLKGRVKLG